MNGGKTAKMSLFAAGVLMLLIGVLCTPENLMRLEIMENSLNSPSELIRKGAQIEIAVARTFAFSMAAVLFLLTLFWSRIAASARYRAFMQRENARRRNRLMFYMPSLVIMMAAIGLVFLYMLVADKILTPEQMLMVQREDGIIESLSALLLIFASALSFRIAIRLGRKGPEFYMHLFLGLLFFVMFGEEISWGQRYLGLQTPEFISAVNAQDEINLHNLFGYFFDHVFILGFFLWGVAVPLLDRFAPFFRQLFAVIGLPVPTAGLAAAMLVITLMQSVIVYRFLDPFAPPFPWLRLPEPREMLSALAFLVLMLEVWVLVARRVPAQTPQDAPGGEPGIPARARRH